MVKIFVAFVLATVLLVMFAAGTSFGQCPGGCPVPGKAVTRVRSVQFFPPATKSYALMPVPQAAAPVNPAAAPCPAPQAMPVGPRVPMRAVPQTPEPPLAPHLFSGAILESVHAHRMARIERRHQAVMGVFHAVKSVMFGAGVCP